MTPEEMDRLGRSLAQGGELNENDRNRYENLRTMIAQAVIPLGQSLELMIPGTTQSSRLKHLESVAAKLRRRPGLRLTEISDIAGYRLITRNRSDQLEAAEIISRQFEVSELDDKSNNPKFGYRAIHIDIKYENYPVEIQLQTRNQALWQMVSETAAGLDIEIKYGGGKPAAIEALLNLSETAFQCDLTNTILGTEQTGRTINTIYTIYEQREQ